MRTSLPMVVADELEADWSRVRVRQAQGDEARFGNQDTDGSRSVRHFFAPMRRCGAAARTMLEQAAARNGASRCRSRGEPSRGRPSADEPPAGIWRAGDRGVAPAGSGARQASSQGACAVPLHRQGQREDRRRRRHRRGTRRATASTRDLDGLFYAVVARPPVYGGKVASLRRERLAQGTGRRARRRDSGYAAALRVPAARRHGGDRAQHLGGDPGPRSA